MSRRTPATLAIAVVLVLVTALTGCGSAGSGGSEQRDGKTIVRWSLWAGGAEEQAQWQHVADLVNQTYPDIEVELRTSPFADYFTEIKTQLAGGQASCVVTMQSVRLPTFVDAIEPLDRYMAEGGFDHDAWNPAALKALQWQGKQLGLPYGFSTLLMYYNRDAFEKAGLPLPDQDWTTAEFERAARKLSEDGRPAFGLSFSDLHMSAMLRAYNGARPVDENGQLQLDSAKMREAFAWYAGLATKQRVASTPASASDIPWGEQQFAAGNVAMAVDGSWNLGANLAAADFRVGVAPVPRGPKGGSAYIADSGFVVPKTCEAKEAAYKAIKVISGPRAQSYLAGLGRAYPAITAQEKAFEDYLRSDVTTKTPELATDVERSIRSGFEGAVPFLGSSDWDRVTKLIAQEFLRAYTGDRPAGEVLRTVQQQAERG